MVVDIHKTILIIHSIINIIQGITTMDIKVTIRTTTMIMVITIITNQVHNDILVLHLKLSSYYVNYNGRWVRGDNYNNNNDVLTIH